MMKLSPKQALIQYINSKIRISGKYSESRITLVLTSSDVELILQHLQGTSEEEQIKKEYAAPITSTKKAVTEFVDTDEQIVQVERIVKEALPEATEIRKAITDKLKKMLFGKTTDVIPVIQVHSMMKLILAESNIDKYYLVDAAFPDEDRSTIRHLNEKFLTSGKNIFRFIPLLSEDLRGRLLLYIANNYAGEKFETIEQYYMPKPKKKK